MCSTNESYLQWNVTVPGFQSEPRTWFHGATAVQQIEINSIKLNISIGNAAINSSLSSVIISENVTANLNGTTIACSEIHTVNRMTTMTVIATTMIHIIGNEANHSKLSQCITFYPIK